MQFLTFSHHQTVIIVTSSYRFSSYQKPESLENEVILIVSKMGSNTSLIGSDLERNCTSNVQFHCSTRLHFQLHKNEVIPPPPQQLKSMHYTHTCDNFAARAFKINMHPWNGLRTKFLKLKLSKSQQKREGTSQSESRQSYSAEGQ